MDFETLVRGFIPNSGEYIVGFADLTNLLHESYRKYRFGILLGKKLDDRIVDAILEGPTPEYEALYRDTNAALSSLVHRVAAALHACGVRALAVEPTMSDSGIDTVYRKTLRTNLSHKMVATRSGLGWIGKTALFVSERFGPRLRLATVLTDSPVGRFAAPFNESRCGSCSLCVDKCPAQAANGIPWTTHTDRNVFFDPFKCRETCLELSAKRLNKRISICGICVAVCPVGTRASRSREPKSL